MGHHSPGSVTYISFTFALFNKMANISVDFITYETQHYVKGAASNQISF